MNKLLGDRLRKAKNDIKTRYLAGEAVPPIARSYGISDRSVYYHLGRITPDEKALHTKNWNLRLIAEKQRKEEHGQKAKPSAEGSGQATESSLVDFVEK